MRGTAIPCPSLPRPPPVKPNFAKILEPKPFVDLSHTPMSSRDGDDGELAVGKVEEETEGERERSTEGERERSTEGERERSTEDVVGATNAAARFPSKDGRNGTTRL